MVRLDRIKAKYGLKCDLVAKCEFFNAGGRYFFFFFFSIKN